MSHLGGKPQGDVNCGTVFSIFRELGEKRKSRLQTRARGLCCSSAGLSHCFQRGMRAMNHFDARRKLCLLSIYLIPLKNVLLGVFYFLFLFFVFFAISWATHTAYGCSQARGRVRAIAAGLHQSHSNAGSELSLQPTPQLTATPDP